MELALQLLTPGGVAGFVLPRTALRGPSAGGVRSLLSERGVADVSDYRGLQMFPGATPYVATVTVGGPAHQAGDAFVVGEYVPDSRAPSSLVLDPELRADAYALRSGTWPRGQVGPDDWTPFTLRWVHELRRSVGVPIEPFAAEEAQRRVVHGTQTGNDTRFLIDDERVHISEGADEVLLDGTAIPSWALPRYAGGQSILPFRLREGRRLLSPYPTEGGRRITDPVLASLVDRLGGAPKNAQPGDLAVLRRPKVLLRAFGKELAVAADPLGAWTTKKGTGGGLAISVAPSTGWMLDGVATLLNSALYQWLLRGFGKPRSNETVEILRSHVEALPWPMLEGSDWRQLAKAGEAVRAALTLPEGPDRTAAYWDSPAAADDLVHDLLAVGSHLRAVVNDELIRPG